MTAITVRKEMLTTFKQARELTPVREPSGRIIGYYAPRSLERAKNHAKLATRFDPAEIEKRAKSKKRGYTTKEVFQHLQTLTKDRTMKKYLQGLIDRLEQRDRCAIP
jgi:hypothetical protein